MGRGGKRLGAGRPAGSASARTREIANAIVEHQETPLEIMVRFMNEAALAGDADRAVKFAAIAAPYIHPKLSSVEFVEPEQKREEPRMDFSKLSTEEIKTWIALHEKATRELPN